MAINVAEELKIVGYDPMYKDPEGQPVYNLPITPKENLKRFFFKKDPMWIPTHSNCNSVLPVFIPDVKVRAMIQDVVPYDALKDASGPDMFGIEWEYVPQVGGSSVRPGAPAIDYLEEDWKDHIKLPDVDSWDWEGAAERYAPYINTGRANTTMIYTGLFERLISWMDYSNAAVALIDEDQQPVVHEVFDYLCGIYEKYIYNLHKYLKIDLITFHDDWGTQRAPAFSLDTAMEMLVPYLKRIVNYCHSLDIVFDFHSCGKIEQLVPAMVEAGCDSWGGQPLNDFEMLSDKYGNAVYYSHVWKKYNKNEFASEEDFLNQTVELWKKYAENYKGIWLNCGRGYNKSIDEKFFQMTYPIGREMFAK